MRPKATKEKCFLKPIVLDFFEVMHYLQDLGYGDVHDVMFDMFTDWDPIRNDGYNHIYRHWIQNETSKTVFDAIVEELGLEWEEPSYLQTLIDEGLRTGEEEPDWLDIVFWVSW